MLSSTEKKSTEFVVDFINFFKKFVGSAAESLRNLADMQKKYPKEYQQFKEVQIDPTTMLKYFDTMNPNIRSRLLNMLFTSMALTQKVNTNIYRLNAKEQTKLAGEIEQFIKLAEKSLEEIEEIEKEVIEK